MTMAQPKCSTELRLMKDFCEYPEIRKPLISNDTIVHIQESSLECGSGTPLFDEGRGNNMCLACVVTWLCCPLLGLYAVYASVLSRRALSQRDFSRADSCARTSLWISVVALVLGGFFWVAVGAALLLKLKGYDFTYVLYS